MVLNKSAAMSTTAQLMSTKSESTSRKDGGYIFHRMNQSTQNFHLAQKKHQTKTIAPNIKQEVVNKYQHQTPTSQCLLVLFVNVTFTFNDTSSPFTLFSFLSKT